MRRAESISHLDANEAEGGGVFGAMGSEEVLALIERRAGMKLQFVPETDPSRLSLLSYSQPGDRMAWHRDGNGYYGERWVGIFVLRNRCEASQGLSHAKLEFRHSDGSGSEANMPENSLTLFQGSRLTHRVTPILEGQHRLVLSMLLCDVCRPRGDLVSRAYQAMVNLCFYGHL